MNGNNTSFKVEREFLIHGLYAFQKFRRKGSTLLTNCISRLISQYNPPTLDGGFEDQNQGFSLSALNRSWNSSLYKFLKRISNAAYYIAKIISLMSSYSNSKSRLNAITSHGIEITLVALESSRLDKLNDSTSLRDCVGSLATNFSNPNGGKTIKNSIKNSSCLVIADANLVSPLWDDKISSSDEKLFIIDFAYLITLGCTAFLKNPYQFIRDTMKSFFMPSEFRNITTSRLGNIKSIVAGIMFSKGYSMLLGQKGGELNAYFFTSNSHPIELLRLHLMYNQRCKAIVEILHGIPTMEHEEYASDLEHLSNKFDLPNKSYVIPQLPNNCLYGVFERQTGYSQDSSINTFINNYLLQEEFQKTNISEAVLSQLSRIISKSSLINATTIISFAGGQSHDDDYISSGAFQLEHLILNSARNVLKEINQPFVLLYTPHPSHKLNDFKKIPFFSYEGVYLYPDTVTSWFISDICLGLLSSALFEASYFGAESFTPMTSIDEIYPVKLLDLLSHPHETSQKSIETEMEHLIRTHHKGTHQDILEKIDVRSKLFPTAIYNKNPKNYDNTELNKDTKR